MIDLVVLFLLEYNLGVQSEPINWTGSNKVRPAKQGLQGLHAVQVIGRILIGPFRERHVYDADSTGLQSPFNFADELFRIKRVIEDVGEFEVEGVVAKWLVMEIAADYKGRVGDQVDAHGVGHAHPFESLDLLPDPGADAESLGGILEEAVILELGKEGGENFYFAIPVSGCPDLSELRIQGLVELALDVGVVCFISGSYLKIRLVESGPPVILLVGGEREEE